MELLYYTPYGCLVEHRAVCGGYTKSFQIIMHRLGVTCRNVIDFSNKTGENHTWNYVEYEGEYYWVDVTWDDPVFVTDFDYSDNGSISHAYFFITSEELMKTHSVNYENSLFVPECTATEYNYMRYAGNYLQEYSFEEIDRMFFDGNGSITVTAIPF